MNRLLALLLCIVSCGGSTSIDYAKIIEQNVQEKIVFLPRRLSAMQVSRLGQIRYVDSGAACDYMNTVVGSCGISGPLNYKEANYITRHYTEQSLPASWIQMSDCAEGFTDILKDSDWRATLNLTGYAASYDDLVPIIRHHLTLEESEESVTNRPEIDLFECIDAACFSVYAQILGRAVGGDVEALIQYYSQIAEIIAQVRSQLMMALLFDKNDEPMGTVALFVRDGIAGVYELVLLPNSATEQNMKLAVLSVLNLAADYNAKAAVLVRPFEENDLWTELGFKSYTDITVWKHAVDTGTTNDGSEL